MASENRAASALGAPIRRKEAIVLAMNLKAQLLGMTGTSFADSTGLSGGNISTAHDLAKLVRARTNIPRSANISTSPVYQVKVGRRTMRFGNTNLLVRSTRWDIGLSKTGYLSEAGRCLVMQVTLAGRSVIIVRSISWADTRVADADRIRQWLEFAVSRSGVHSRPCHPSRALSERRLGASGNRRPIS